MDSIHFEPVNENTLSDFINITRETLWYPVWPGDESVARDFQRWPRELQQSSLLIFNRRELVGRVVAPLFDDYLIIRDLGLRAQPDLGAHVARALLRRAEQQRARTVRVIIFEQYWPAFATSGFAEQKRRMNMQLDLPRALPATEKQAVRNVAHADIDAVGELMAAAYCGTVDDEGEDCEQWTSHTRDIIEGLYGKFINQASFVTPPSPPFHSATLLIENAPHCAILAQVMTSHPQTNCGLARRLIAHSLTALTTLDYRRCFLEATSTNANAIHLYRSLGFVEIGPQIFYGLKM